MAQGVERDVGNEAAPFRGDLVGRFRVGVVIKSPVPAIGGDFRDHVSTRERIVPKLANVSRPRRDRRHADDRDVERHGRLSMARLDERSIESREQLGRFGRDLFMKLDDRRHAIAQGRDLTEHVKPGALLLGGRDRFEGGRAPFLRSSPLPATRRRPALSASRLVRSSSAPFPWRTSQPRFLFESVDERRGADADLMTRPGFEQNGPCATDRLLLKSGDDRAGSDGFLCEQVSRAQKHADVHAPIDERAAIVAIIDAERAS